MTQSRRNRGMSRRFAEFQTACREAVAKRGAPGPRFAISKASGAPVVIVDEQG